MWRIFFLVIGNLANADTSISSVPACAAEFVPLAIDLKPPRLDVSLCQRLTADLQVIRSLRPDLASIVYLNFDVGDELRVRLQTRVHETFPPPVKRILEKYRAHAQVENDNEGAAFRVRLPFLAQLDWAASELLKTDGVASVEMIAPAPRTWAQERLGRGIFVTLHGPSFRYQLDDAPSRCAEHCTESHQYCFVSDSKGVRMIGSMTDARPRPVLSWHEDPKSKGSCWSRHD